MITAAFEAICSQHGARPAMGSGPESWSYDDTQRWSRAWADVFSRVPAWTPGAFVALQLPNGPHFPVAFLALARIGVAALPVSTRWTASEIRQAMSGRPVRGVITTRANERSWAEACPGVTCLFVEDLPSCPKDPTAPSEHDRDRPIWSDSPALALLTSGTTAQPKMVIRSQSALVANGQTVARRLNVGPGRRVLSVVPFYHANGLSNGMLMPLLHGATIILTPVFFPRALVDSVREHDVDILIASPFVYASLLDLTPLPEGLGRVAVAISSGAPMRLDTVLGCQERLGLRVTQLYGSSETGTIAIESPDTIRTGRSVGTPLEHVEVRIVGEPSDENPSKGRIAVRSPALMTGYWTGSGIDPARSTDGFYDTGDVGSVSADGELVLEGRSRPVINVGGDKISGEEIEGVLNRIPGVVGSRVRGVPHERQTEIIEAHLRLDDRSSLTRADVVAHCRQHLAEHKIPRIITFVSTGAPDLPVKMI